MIFLFTYWFDFDLVYRFICIWVYSEILKVDYLEDFLHLKWSTIAMKLSIFFYLIIYICFSFISE